MADYRGYVVSPSIGSAAGDGCARPARVAWWGGAASATEVVVLPQVTHMTEKTDILGEMGVRTGLFQERSAMCRGSRVCLSGGG